MTLDERLKLGEPLMLLIGSCEGIYLGLKHGESKAAVDELLKKARKMQEVWEQVTSTKG